MFQLSSDSDSVPIFRQYQCSDSIPVCRQCTAGIRTIPIQTTNIRTVYQYSDSVPIFGQC